MTTTTDTAEDAKTISASTPNRTWRRRSRATRRSGDRPRQNGGGGAVYGIGMIGAAAYFYKAAVSREDYILALPKAMFWPALFVYEALKRLYGTPTAAWRHPG
jgi:hypothetical protein